MIDIKHYWSLVATARLYWRVGVFGNSYARSVPEAFNAAFCIEEERLGGGLQVAFSVRRWSPHSGEWTMIGEHLFDSLEDAEEACLKAWIKTDFETRVILSMNEEEWREWSTLSKH